MKKNILKKIIFMVTITCLISSPVQASWIKNSTGTWNWVENNAKTIGWKYINGKWYYFNNNGDMKTGWLKENNNWYCLADDGHMFTGWVCYSKKWYYFNNSGVMQTGWLTHNNEKYYLDDSGVMQTGTVDIEGKRYTFSDNGSLISSEEITTTSNSNSNSNSSSNTVESESNELKEPIQNLTAVTDRNIFGNSDENFTIIDDISNNQEKEDNNKNEEDKSKDNELNDFSYEDLNLDDNSLAKDVIRTEAPEEDDERYYSDLNIFYKAKLSPPFYSGNKEIKGNCTWYAWGRIFELTGKAPNDAGFNGNAYEWWDANKKIGKYKYGSEPKVGALAVWNSSLPGSGGCGHVAVIEKIEDNKIYISESSWHGSTFKYRELYSTDYLYGYIYIDEPNF